MRGESGQATFEWVALVLLAALVLGGLAAVRAPAEGRGLGRMVTTRMVCAASGRCPSGAGSAAVHTAALAARAGAPPDVGRAGEAGSAQARARRAVRAGVRVRAGLRRTGQARLPRDSRTRAIDAFRRLRGVGALARRVWIVCLGYRRFMYELDHPRAPTEAMPLEEALDIADTCLNPAAFLEDG